MQSHYAVVLIPVCMQQGGTSDDDKDNFLVLFRVVLKQ